MDKKLQHYLSLWSLSDAVPMAVGRATSSVYRVTIRSGSPAILKILTDLGMDDEAGGAVALSLWKGRGAVQLLRHDDGAHLLEYADGENLQDIVHRGEDDRATAILGDVLATLHAAGGVDEAGALLTPLRRRFQSLFEVAARMPGTIYARAAMVAEELLAAPLNQCVLHGDMHHQNVIHCTGRGWLAIDPKGLVGETTYDAANTLLNPHGVDTLIESPERIRRMAGLLAGRLEIDTARLLRFTFAHACLSASWSMEDRESPAHALKMAGIIEPMVF